MKKIFIIAEAGVNHNGSLKIARKMVDEAVKAGADAVKFQTFKAENVISVFAPKAEYQKRTTGKSGSQLDMARRYELGHEDHKYLINYCGKRKIKFLSSPFDLESIDLLDNLGLKIFKIPSGEITNLPYLRKIGSLRKKIILSTGMSNMSEVKRAIDILTGSGTAKKDITVLQCNTDYPTNTEDANILAMVSMRKKLGLDTGYSDHTAGIEVSIAAAALGASVIEKHFTLDKRMKGPDHKASLDPKEFSVMVKAIRNTEKALGSGVKFPSRSEEKNKKVARKSIVALKGIKKGERLTACNMTVKRPGNGISPMEWDSVIGKTAKRNFKKDELIK